MSSLSVIVASSGRPTLARTIGSLVGQLKPGDELLLDVNDDAPWGHRARNRQMQNAKGDALLFLDDDDAYRPDAFEMIRAAFAEDPERMHMFRMRYAENGNELWQSQEVKDGNVSTQMVVVPRLKVFPLGIADHGPRWGDRYQGDLDFIVGCQRVVGEPVWHSEVIVDVRPHLHRAGRD